MKLSLIERLRGVTKADKIKRARQDADVIASAIDRARMKATAASEDAERRRRTDTAIHDMKRATQAASAMALGAGGLTAQEIAAMPDDERERFLRTVAGRNGTR